jgi:hypothetical protein
VDTSKLHVFLTPHVAGNALAVTARSTTGFTVTEGNGGKSGGGFTYRVVAKRKDIAAPRLAKATLVTLPAPLPPTPPVAVPNPPTPAPLKAPTAPPPPPIPPVPHHIEEDAAPATTTGAAPGSVPVADAAAGDFGMLPMIRL